MKTVLISRLTIGTAIVNLALSAFIIFTIIGIQNETKSYVHKSITQNQVSQDTNQININEQINNTVTSTTGEEEDNNINESNTTSSNPASGFNNYVLNNEEMQVLVHSGNPFGSSLAGDTEALKRKIEKELEEERNISKAPVSNDSEETTSNTPDTEENTSSEHQDIIDVADLKAKKYDVPAAWLTSVIETLSNYQVDLSTQDGDITRSGIMQLRDSDVPFITKNIGDKLNSEDKADSNIEMGAYYLAYLSKQSIDKNYPFTTYYLGKEEADKLYKKTGSYESEFSKTILKKLKTT